MPMGLREGFESDNRWLVKWILLTPAIWPEIPDGQSKRGTERNPHPGGWLPNWIEPSSGSVLLRGVNREERKRRRSLNFDGKGYLTTDNSDAIGARLVSAVVPKPLVITGWVAADEKAGRPSGGAKSTHLAVPAGAVYYFEAKSEADACALANALNWHGKTDGSEIQNRRSTLLGEKGYGLGVCGQWQFHETSPDVSGSNKNNATQ